MRAVLLLFIFATSSSAIAADPQCSGVDNWASNMAFVHLKNAGITNNDNVVWGQRKVVRLASEKIGKDLYRQVHRVTFPQTDGSVIEVITVSDASQDECSMSDVDVFVVSQHLGL